MAKSKKTNTAFTKIVAEAKRIRKAHPAMKWTNAIKDAAKHIKSGAKTVVKKASSAKKKAISIKKVAKKRVVHAKSAVKHAKKALGIGSINKSTIESIERNLRLIGIANDFINDYKEKLKKSQNSENKKWLRRDIKLAQDSIKTYKKQISQLKKHIK